MKKLITVIAVVTMFVAASASSSGADSCCCAPMGVGYRDITEIPGLNLTKKQAGQITSLKAIHLEPLQKKMFGKRYEIMILLRSKPPDQKKLMAAEKELIAIREQLYGEQETYRKEVIKMLTPKQQAKLRSYGFSL
jgi:Spy/CpxP family protein refolding chaperone